MPVEDMKEPCPKCGGRVRGDEWGLYCCSCNWRKNELRGEQIMPPEEF